MRPEDAEAGAVTIEFAVVAVVFLMILFGIISFGLQFGVRILATQAASEGARAAVVGLDTTERVSLARAAVATVLDAYGGLASGGRRTVTVTPVGSPATRIDVTVAIDLSAFGLQRLARFAPDLGNPRATVSVQVDSGP